VHHGLAQRGRGLAVVKAALYFLAIGNSETVAALLR
jgi:hypothetical protein